MRHTTFVILFFLAQFSIAQNELSIGELQIKLPTEWKITKRDCDSNSHKHCSFISNSSDTIKYWEDIVWKKEHLHIPSPIIYHRTTIQHIQPLLYIEIKENKIFKVHNNSRISEDSLAKVIKPIEDSLNTRSRQIQDSLNTRRRQIQDSLNRRKLELKPQKKLTDSIKKTNLF